MKIGLVNPYSVQKNGGVQEIIFSLADQLTRKKHDVRIITPRPKNFDEAEITTKKNVIFIGNGNDISLRSLRTTGQISAGEKAEIADVLTHEQFDVLHLHEPWVPFLPAQILQENAKLKHPARTVGTFHAKMPDNWGAKTFAGMIRPYTKPLLKYLDQLTAVSPAASEHVARLTREEIIIIPNGVAIEKFAKANKYSVQNKQRKQQETDADKIILYLGRLDARKGVKYLLRAFALLAKKMPHTRLIIAGDGIERQRLEELSRVLELKNVEFPGFVDEKTKYRLLTDADLFVSPALYGESFGIVLLESMAAHTPIVAGDNPGYASVLTGLGEISLVNPKHIMDFTRRLEVFLREPDLQRLWREWAEREVPRYSYVKIASEYEKVYQAEVAQ